MIFFDLESGLTDQTIHDTLDGVPVTLRIIWNERFKYWTMSIYDRQQAAIITGVKLVRDYPLISRFNLSQLAGDFIFYRVSGPDDEASFDSLGVDYELVYLSEVEINVIR